MGVVDHGKHTQIIHGGPKYARFKAIDFDAVTVFTADNIAAIRCDFTGEYRGDFIGVIQVEGEYLHFQLVGLRLEPQVITPDRFGIQIRVGHVKTVAGARSQGCQVKYIGWSKSTAKVGDQFESRIHFINRMDITGQVRWR